MKIRAQVCDHCGNLDLARSQRSRGERMLSWIVPARPFRCPNCKKRTWRAFDLRDQWAHYVSAGLFWGLVLLLLLVVFCGGTAPRDGAATAADTRDAAGPQAISGVVLTAAPTVHLHLGLPYFPGPAPALYSKRGLRFSLPAH